MKTSTKIIAWASAIAFGAAVTLQPIVNDYVPSPPKDSTELSESSELSELANLAKDFEAQKERLENRLLTLGNSSEVTNENSRVYVAWGETIREYQQLRDNFDSLTNSLPKK